MDLVGTAINAAVVAAIGVILAWLGKGRIDEQDRRLERLDQRMDAFQASLDALRSEINGSLTALRTELNQSQDSLRSDLTQVALAVGVRRGATNA